MKMELDIQLALHLSGILASLESLEISRIYDVLILSWSIVQRAQRLHLCAEPSRFKVTEQSSPPQHPRGHNLRGMPFRDSVRSGI